MLSDPIIVAGGGIGGLATALALAHKGFRVIVLERAARYEEIGAGIQLGPNAFHAFDIRAEAANITVPTLVFHVRGDAMVPFEAGRRLAG